MDHSSLRYSVHCVVTRCVITAQTTVLYIIQALVLKPFLTKYQTEKPMVHFMAEGLKAIFQVTLRKIIKKDKIDEEKITDLISVDLEKMRTCLVLISVLQ